MSAAPLRRNLIDALGYGDIVLEKAKTMLPAQIKADLMADPDFTRKLNGVGRIRLYTTDITVFLSRTAVDASTALAENDGRSAAIAAAAARDHVMSVIAMAQHFDGLTNRFQGILEDELDKFEEESQQPDGKPKLPLGLWEQVRKSMATSASMAKSLADDSRLQGLIRAGTVNVNHGMTTEEVHEAIFGVGKILGVPEKNMMEAYTTYLIQKKKGQKPVDVEAIDPKAMRSMPFVKSMERSLDLPVIPDEPVPGSMAGA